MSDKSIVRYIFKCPGRMPTLSAIDIDYWEQSHVGVINILLGGAYEMAIIGGFAICSSSWADLYQMEPCCTIGDRTFRGPVIICGYHNGQLTDVGNDFPEEIKKGLYPNG